MDTEINELKGNLSYDDSVSLIMHAINNTTDDKMKDSDSSEDKPHIEMEFDFEEMQECYSLDFEEHANQHISPSKSPL